MSAVQDLDPELVAYAYLYLSRNTDSETLDYTKFEDVFKSVIQVGLVDTHRATYESAIKT